MTVFQLYVHDKFLLLKFIYHINKSFSILCFLIVCGFSIAYKIKIKLTQRCQISTNFGIWFEINVKIFKNSSKPENKYIVGRLHELMTLGVNLCTPPELWALHTGSAQSISRGWLTPPSLVDAWAMCQTSPLVSVTEWELQDTSQNCWCTMDVPALSECNTDTLHFQLWRELSECMGGSLKCFDVFGQNSNFTNLRILQEHFIRKISHLACPNISKHTKK